MDCLPRCFAGAAFLFARRRKCEAVILPAESDIYTEADIRAADAAVRYFKEEFDGCTLKELRCAGDEAAEQFAEWEEQYNTCEAIVLLSIFDVDASGGDGSLTRMVLMRIGSGFWEETRAGNGSASPTDTAEQSEAARGFAGGCPIGGGRLSWFCGRGESRGLGGNPALQESLGKFVQKITRRRFTPGNSRVIMEPHGVRRECAPVPCLGEIAVPGRQIYRR